MREDDFVVCSSYALISRREGGNFCTYREGVRIQSDLGLPDWITPHGLAGNGFVYTASMSSNILLSLIDTEIACLHQARSILAPIAKSAGAGGRRFLQRTLKDSPRCQTAEETENVSRSTCEDSGSTEASLGKAEGQSKDEALTAEGLQPLPSASTLTGHDRQYCPFHYGPTSMRPSLYGAFGLRRM